MNDMPLTVSPTDHHSASDGDSIRRSTIMSPLVLRNTMFAKENFWKFFIKLHRARSLHLDLRLEHNGVLKSWYLPPHLFLNPTHSHQATSTIDHQLKYGPVERVIPAGLYGAGPMLLWDYGLWLPGSDVDQGLRDGHLRFHLRGSRLKGGWSLTRSFFDGRGEVWALTKEDDAEAWPLSERNLVAEMPTSVLTGKTLDEVAADPGHVAPPRSARSRKNGPHRNQPLLPFGDPES